MNVSFPIPESLYIVPIKGDPGFVVKCEECDGSMPFYGDSVGLRFLCLYAAIHEPCNNGQDT